MGKLASTKQNMGQTSRNHCCTRTSHEFSLSRRRISKMLQKSHHRDALGCWLDTVRNQAAHGAAITKLPTCAISKRELDVRTPEFGSPKLLTIQKGGRHFPSRKRRQKPRRTASRRRFDKTKITMWGLGMRATAKEKEIA